MHLTGKKAIHLIKVIYIDLIMVHMMMPFASGTEILPAIISFSKYMLVIILSGLGQEEVVLKAFNLAAADFMLKPFRPTDLH